MTEAIKKLDWDSDFFEMKIGTVENLENLIESDFEKFDLIANKVSTSKLDISSRFADLGFTPVEGELLFVKNIIISNKIVDSIPLAVVNETEIGEVKRISMTSYNISRFKSPWFSEKQKNNFYGEWAEKAVLGLFDDICLAYKVRGAIAGFITLKKCEEYLVIGLIAVDSDLRGQGIASKLLLGAEKYAIKQNCKYIKVATQLSNISASNLYIKNGYRLSETSIWLYK
jgi:dTDP-4-amino-4,6-dideoxy-D-galactose acyltransferase